MTILGTVASSFRSAGGATYELIGSTTITSNTTQVLFTGIPATYTHLECRISARSTRNNYIEDFYFMLNNTSNTYTSTSFTGRMIFTDGGQTDPSYLVYTTPGFISGLTTTSNSYGSVRLYIFNYAENQNKTWNYEGHFTDYNNTSRVGMGIGGGLWSDTAAVTSINFINPNGNYVAPSTFSVYGIKTS